MKKFRKFISDLFSNPDGSGSTKRTAGNMMVLCIMVTVGFTLLLLYKEKLKPGMLTEIAVFIVTLVGAAATFYGISSYDSAKYFNFLDKNKKEE